MHAKYAAEGAAPDRGGQGRHWPTCRDLFDLVADADYRFILFMRRSALCRAEPGYASAQGGAGRLAGRPFGQCADLRHLQPPPPDAGIHGGKSGNPPPRRRGASGRERPRKRSPCPTASGCGCRFTAWTRTPISPSRGTGRKRWVRLPTTASSAPRCNGRSDAAHAMAGWRGNSRGIGRGNSEQSHARTVRACPPPAFISARSAPAESGTQSFRDWAGKK